MSVLLVKTNLIIYFVKITKLSYLNLASRTFGISRACTAATKRNHCLTIKINRAVQKLFIKLVHGFSKQKNNISTYF